MQGRVTGENQRLTFAPPLWYDVLVLACLLGGGASAVTQLLMVRLLPATFGLLILFAGVWAVACNERLHCNLRAGTYVRIKGWGRLSGSWSRGSLASMQALVLLAELRQPLGVMYRLVLHWKPGVEPLLIVEQDGWNNLSPSDPLQAKAGRILAKALRYSNLLGVPFYDRSQIPSGPPLRVI